MFRTLSDRSTYVTAAVLGLILTGWIVDVAVRALVRPVPEFAEIRSGAPAAWKPIPKRGLRGTFVRDEGDVVIMAGGDHEIELRHLGSHERTMIESLGVDRPVDLVPDGDGHVSVGS